MVKKSHLTLGTDQQLEFMNPKLLDLRHVIPELTAHGLMTWTVVSQPNEEVFDEKLGFIKKLLGVWEVFAVTLFAKASLGGFHGNRIAFAMHVTDGKHDCTLTSDQSIIKGEREPIPVMGIMQCYFRIVDLMALNDIKIRAEKAFKKKLSGR